MEDVVGKMNELKKECEEMRKEIERLKEEKKSYLQNIGMVRFNPFSDGGGDQSFSLVLLNKKGDGVAVTSLYTKEANRVYGKPIKNGKSEYSLSKEEERAIKEALGEVK